MEKRWYFNQGRVPVPVHIGGGRQYAVRPRGYVFIDPQDAPPQLIQSGKPKNADGILAHLKVVVEPVATMADMTQSVSRFAATVTEIEPGKAAEAPTSLKRRKGEAKT